MSRKTKSVDHDAWIKQKLQNPEFAAAYLSAASEDEDPRVYLATLRQVVQARGGIKKIAEKNASLQGNALSNLVISGQSND